MIFTQVPKVIDKVSDSPVETNDTSLVELQKKELAEKTYRLTILLRAIVKLGCKSFEEYDSFCIESIKDHPICGIVLPSELNVEIDRCIDLIQTSGSISKALLAYREQMMKGFSKESQQKDGKVYTPPEIVNWIHDKLELYNQIDLNKTYWEPTCGTGSFVIDWYERLMEHWIKYKGKYPQIKDENEAHKWIIENCLYYSDIDPFAIRLCTLQLFLKNPRVKGIKYNSHCGDSLLDEPFKEVEKFDYVAGNPPYTEVENHHTYSSYKTCNGRNARLSGLFIEQGRRRSRTTGFIVDDTTLLGDSSYSQQVRAIIINVDIEYEKSLNTFKKEGVGTRAISFVTSINLKDSILNGKKVFNWLDEIKRERFGVDQNSNPIILKLSERKGLGHKEWAFSINNGVETGDNEKFVLKIPPDKYLTVLTTKAATKYAKTEAYEYLDLSEANLIKGQTKLKEWETKDDYVIARYNVGSYKDINFALIREVGFIGLHHSVFMLQSKDNKKLLGILNSSLIRFFLFSKGGKQQSGGRRITIGLYRQLPLPSIMECDQLIPLVDKMLLDPNDKVTEAEINKIVYELYNLTPEEIKTIEETVK